MSDVPPLPHPHLNHSETRLVCSQSIKLNSCTINQAKIEMIFLKSISSYKAVLNNIVVYPLVLMSWDRNNLTAGSSGRAG